MQDPCGNANINSWYRSCIISAGLRNVAGLWGHDVRVWLKCMTTAPQPRVVRSIENTQWHTTALLCVVSSLLFGISVERIKRLQSIQNAAVRLVSGTQKFDRITPVLQNLHWPPVAKRIMYKVVMMLVHKCLNGRAPSYLADVCILVDTLPGRR